MRGRDSVPLHSAPHLHDGASTSRMMWTVVVCLVPAGAWGVWSYGWRALLVVAVAVGAALAGELVADILTRRFTLDDGSAFLSGLLIGYMLPVGVPLYIPAAASLFAMLVIKASFGGLGSNSMNPAVGGQVFVYFSWSGALSAWGVPRLWPSGISVGAPSVLSPLQYSAEQVMHLATGAGTRAGHFLESYPVSPIATTIAAWLNHVLRTVLDPHYIDLLLGNVPGDIGTVSAVLLLAGGSYLFYKGIITWHAPVGFLATFVVLVWIFGGLPLNLGWFSGLPFFHLLSGATLLAALFLGTDPVTSPLSRGGMVVFGIGIGTLSFLIRILGAAEEAVFMAILLMNISVPAIDRLMERRAHGTA